MAIYNIYKCIIVNLHDIVYYLFILPALNCPDLIAPQNGDVDQTGNIPGDMADYTCDSGFTLIGDQRRVCQANGFWTGISPLCESE